MDNIDDLYTKPQEISLKKDQHEFFHDTDLKPSSKYFVNEDNVVLLLVSYENVSKFRYVMKRHRNKAFPHFATSKSSKSSLVSPSSPTKDGKRDNLQDLLQSPERSHDSNTPTKAKDSNKNDSQSLVSKEQLNLLAEDIFSSDNLEAFIQCHNKSLANIMTTQFIVNLIMDNDLQRGILKFDEHFQSFRIMTTEEVFSYLLKTFMDKTKEERKQIKDSKVTKKTNITLDKGYVSVNSKQHPINSWMRYGYKFYNNVKNSNDWCHSVLHKDDETSKIIQKDYDENKYKAELSDSLYSILHPLYDEYELIVYNGSHRLPYSCYGKDHVIVHSNTKLRLKFPKPEETDMKSFFVIFNSKLVHCGSKAKREAILSSNHCLNFRLFTYAMQSFCGTKTKLLKNYIPTENDLLQDIHLEYTRKGVINQTSFKICDSEKCKTCKETPGRKSTGTNPDIVIDVKKEYLFSKDKKKSGLCPSSYLCGDLDEGGWEIHQGIPYLTDVKTFKFLRMHLEYLHKRSKSDWNTIVKNSGREYIKLEELNESESKQTNASKKFLKEICYPSLHEIVWNIDGFRNNKLQGNILFGNRKLCVQQNLHRDYTPLEKRADIDKEVHRTSKKRKASGSEGSSGIRSSTRATFKPKRLGQSS